MMITPPNHPSSDLQAGIAILRDPHSLPEPKQHAIETLAPFVGDTELSAETRDLAIQALAGFAAAPTQPQELRNRAFEALLPVIHGAAKRAASRSRFERRWRPQLLDEAPLLIWERLESFDPAHPGRFQGWCLVVLYRAFVDIGKKLTRDEAPGANDASDYLERVDTSDTRQDEVVSWLDRVGRTRKILDRVACKPDGAREVHLYAVFLMRLRQSMTVLVAKDGCDVTRHGWSVSEIIEERCLAWRSWEERERFKPDLPTLLDIWNALRPVVDDPPHRVEAPALCRCVASLTQHQASLSPSCWNRWVNRAKRCARDKIDRADWDDLFAPLLPDQDPSAKRAESGEGEI